MVIESDNKAHDHDDKPFEGGFAAKAALKLSEYATDLVYHDSPLFLGISLCLEAGSI